LAQNFQSLSKRIAEDEDSTEKREPNIKDNE